MLPGWFEQREDPSLSDDLFMRENATPTLQDDGTMGIRADSLTAIRVAPVWESDEVL